MALTDSAIRATKPKDRLYRLADSNGLCLEIAPTGSKLWRYRYRHNGKAKMMALGAYPAVTLQKARLARDSARQLLVEGIDPGVERKNVKLAQAIDGLTFEALAREWFRYNSPRWASATANKVNAYLESDLLPALGERPVKAVTRPELVGLLRKIESRGAYNVAKKTRQWLSQIFRFGLAKGAIDNNPATDLDVVAAHAPRTKHHPHVTFAELPELLITIKSAKINVITRHAINLLVLTAVRPGELRNAYWSEFDFETSVWRIPAERMKARRDHVVPLPHQAIVILKQLWEITGSYGCNGKGKASQPHSKTIGAASTFRA